MAETTLVQHYLLYLVSSGGIFALLLALPILFLLYKEAQRWEIASDSYRIPGCIRVVRQVKSNLHDQYDPVFSGDAAPRIKALFVYPVKSCRGVELSSCAVTGTGLKYDRLFSFAQLVSSKKPTRADSNGINETDSEITHQWRFITQRENPKLALLSTELWLPDQRKTADKSNPTLVNGNYSINGAPRELGSQDEVEEWSANGGCLVIRFPYEEAGSFFGITTTTITIKVPLQPNVERAKAKCYTYESMAIWKDLPQSINLSNEIDAESLAKLKYFLGVSNPLGLFRVDDTNLRSVTRSLPKDRPDEKFKVGFADAFPVHLLNIASVRALDEALPIDAKAKTKLDAIRFRANIYVSGPEAYGEDRWMRIAVGQSLIQPSAQGHADFHVACRTARCTLPNVHPDSGVKDRNEPHSTLKRTRQVDEGAKPHPCLGLSMIPLFEHGIVRCGDKIEVLEEGEHVYEKMFQ